MYVISCGYKFQKREVKEMTIEEIKKIVEQLAQASDELEKVKKLLFEIAKKLAP